MKLSIGFIMFEPDATLEELHANYDFLEGLDLLRDHDLTANLLYHNQIVLSGSSAWMRHEREERLLYDERTPFEARYRFRDERVGRVCSAMGRMAMEYFRGMAEVRQSAAGSDSCCAQPVHDASSDNDINVLLKEAFLMFCTAAGDPAVHDREEIEALYRLKLKDLLAVRNARILAASAVISQPSHYIHATGVCNP